MTGLTTLGPAAPRYRPGSQVRVVAALWDRLRGGGACVVTGEPGGGRSAFLAFAADAFTAGPVVTVRARPGSCRQPSDGLRALCDAAGVPAVRAAGPVRDLVAALEGTAASGTVLLCVDDAHLWDAASRAALGRLAARLADGGRVALLLTVAGHRPVDPEFAGLPLLRLAPLPAPDAAALLEEAAQDALDPRVRDEISAAAQGNPGLLLRVLDRLTPAQRRGLAPLPCPLADAETLASLAGGHLTGLPAAQRDLLVLTAAAVQVSGEPTVEAGVLRRAAARLAGAVPCAGPALPEPLADDAGGYGPGGSRLSPGAAPLPEPLRGSDGRIGFHSTVLCRTVYAGASAERRRAAHAALARALPDGGALPALLHRSWAVTAPAAALAADLAAAAAGPDPSAPPALRCTALTRAADLASDGARQVRWYTAAAEQALLAGQSDRALRLLDTARGRPAPSAVRARAELLRGAVLRWDGPVDDARETLLLAAELFAPHDPERSAEAALAAADAAWAAGDRAACLRALAEEPAGDRLRSDADSGGHTDDRNGEGAPPGGPCPRPVDRPGGSAAVPSAVLRDHRAGMRAVLEGRFDLATAPLRRVVDGAWTAGDREALRHATGDPAEARGARGDREHPTPAANAPGRPPTTTDASEQPPRTADGWGQPPHAAGDSAAEPPVTVGDREPSTPAADARDRPPHPTDDRRQPPHTASNPDRPAHTTDTPAQPPHTAHDPDRPPRTAGGSSRSPGAAGEPGRLLRAASAALLLGDTAAARRAGARALAVARTNRSAVHEARALEYLAYGELRAGRHALARTHAEEGLRSAYRTGQRNTAAHHHAVLALAASIEGEAQTVAEHVTAALATARRHGLAQAAALAQWAAARADLGHGRPREAAERLGPLVRPGPGRGHFAVWMLAVPCYVEACALAGQPEQAREAVEDFARWSACDADPQAPAQLLRCRALLAPPEAADPVYRQALRRHGEAAGDFERARTELLYGKWLRRRRRLGEARAQLRAALLGFERCGARPWAHQAAAELRANGVAGAEGVSVPGGAVPHGLSRLTPQQMRIARGVAQGLTNREVALSLSVSTRTVDYHLRNVFAALGVRSRMELARLVEQAEKTAAQL
ncbi:LuxR C-terminal-related transcriptional regulator [Streptomyces tricolor]|uniref:LuxR C-terminal-related transcriptional regulator n=1 Tax=Streptomyces tricolor TaxID=68277 RepID=A0ABS9J8Y7_9ACTN|nr:helix-turn-helix transcriptional regulator [Streptomyces tricolor]MCG0062026.1 LuxR C-terminal-related transcriptional regulator [Streptomyces tricolor]